MDGPERPGRSFSFNVERESRLNDSVHRLVIGGVIGVSGLCIIGAVVEVVCGREAQPALLTIAGGGIAWLTSYLITPAGKRKDDASQE